MAIQSPAYGEQVIGSRLRTCLSLSIHTTPATPIGNALRIGPGGDQQIRDGHAEHISNATHNTRTVVDSTSRTRAMFVSRIRNGKAW